MAHGEARRRKSGGTRRYYLAAGLLLVLIAVGGVAWWTRGTPAQDIRVGKAVILYVNQGNGVVNATNFASMASFAAAQGFNTVFFQVYRAGVQLFSQHDLEAFVSQAHAENLSIFFALYLTNSSQKVPLSVLTSGEDGVSLDMSSLSLASQESLLASLKAEYGGKTAVTTSDMQSMLQPDLLVKETYDSSEQVFIKPGIVGSVGVYKTSSEADYQAQVQYSLRQSSGVMVFDYARLMMSGYQTFP